MGCNDTEIRLISHLTPKREYYVKSPEGRRKISLGIGNIALSFIGVSDKEGIAAVRACHEKHGDEWPVYWLEQNNIDYLNTLERIA